MTNENANVSDPLGSHKSFIIATGLILAACGSPAQKVAAPTEADLRLAKAEAMFQERCKTAGEKIHRTAENVEGVFLMKLRPEGINYSDQFKLDDPYGRDYDGDAYIKSFLRGFNSPPPNPTKFTPTRFGYRFVEALDPKTGQRYRYTGSVREVTKQLSGLSGGGTVRVTEFALDKTPSNSPIPRYGVTYDDISTREEREYWIAGSYLKVIDLQTNEVMAERIGYMLDRRQGNRGGGRSPWLLAADFACPTFVATHGAVGQLGQTELFVQKVLAPLLEK